MLYWPTVEMVHAVASSFVNVLPFQFSDIPTHLLLMLPLAAECLHLEELAHVNGPFGALNGFYEPLDRPMPNHLLEAIEAS
jgi:hypothetical protein